MVGEESVSLRRLSLWRLVAPLGTIGVVGGLIVLGAPAVAAASTPTTTFVSTNANSATAGDPLTIIATMTPSSAGGFVDFVDNGTLLNAAPVVDGSASLTVPTLGAGTHTLQADFVPTDGTSETSEASMTEIVDQPQTSTALSSSCNPCLGGQPAVFSATVSPPGATGNVQFAVDGSNTGAPVPLIGGSASFIDFSLPPGSSLLTATYLGDANDGRSTAMPLVEQIITEATSLSLSSSASPSLPGQPVTSGASNSDSLTQVVLQPTSVTFESSRNPSFAGQAVTFTATVVPAPAGGTVTLLDGTTPLVTAPLTSNVAQLSLSSLPLGTSTISAVYSGDALDEGSTSNGVTQVVQPAGVALKSSVDSSLTGQPLTLTATVAPPTATGTVTFMDGTTPLGSSTVSSGIASFTTSVLAAGTHPITAVYNGDSNDQPATSPVLNQIVLAPTSP